MSGPTMKTPSTIRLPSLEALWAWPRAVNVHLSEVEEESLDWCISFGAFKPEMQRVIYGQGKFTLLAGLMFSYTSKEIVRTACDLVLFFFTFDDQADMGTPEQIMHYCDVVADALRYPDKPRPRGEWVVGELARQFFLRLPKTATETFRQRFIQGWIDFASSVSKEAEHRSQAHFLDLESYLTLRRSTIGTYPTILLYELDMDILDNIREHPTLIQLENTAVDIIAITNDLLSYNKEQAFGGDDHNIVTIIMKQFHLNVQEAFNKAGEIFRERVQRFEALYQQLPRWFGPVDLDVQRLVDGMARCVSGNAHWCYETPRYFGSRGLEVKETRVMNVMAKADRRGKGNPTMSPMPIV